MSLKTCKLVELMECINNFLPNLNLIIEILCSLWHGKHVSVECVSIQGDVLMDFMFLMCSHGW